MGHIDQELHFFNLGLQETRAIQPTDESSGLHNKIKNFENDLEHVQDGNDDVT